MSIRWRLWVVAAAAMAGLPEAAFAYVGPGAGLGALGTLIAFLGAVLLAIVGFIWYPLKRLLRHRKAADRTKDGGDGATK